MGFCQHHATFFEGETCYQCHRYNEWVNSEKKKKEDRINAKFTKKLVYLSYKKTGKKKETGKILKKDNRKKNWMQKADQFFSQYIRLTFDIDGFCKCSTCGKIKETFGGLKGIHSGHYFPKAKYFWLRYRIENALPQCYDCNVNNPYGIAAMRMELVKVHGEYLIKKLEQDSQCRPNYIDRESEILFYKSKYLKFKNLFNNLNKNK